MLVFIPVFFFASEYAQISLGKSATQASLVLLYFFLGFVVAAQVGGRMLDRDRREAAGGPRLRRWPPSGSGSGPGKVTEPRLRARRSGTSSWPAPGWA